MRSRRQLRFTIARTRSSVRRSSSAAKIFHRASFPASCTARPRIFARNSSGIGVACFINFFLSFSIRLVSSGVGTAGRAASPAFASPVGGIDPFSAHSESQVIFPGSYGRPSNRFRLDHGSQYGKKHTLSIRGIFRHNKVAF